MQSNAKYYGAAAEYNKPSGFDMSRLLKIGLLVIAAVVVVTAGYLGFNALTSSGRNDAARLVSRERVLLSFMTVNQASITNDNLKTANSNAISFVTSDSYALQQGLKSEFNVATVPEDIAKSEADTTSLATLATAKVQSRFDQAYVQLLRDKIASAENLASTVINGSSGAMKSASQKSLDNLKAIDGQLSKLAL